MTEVKIGNKLPVHRLVAKIRLTIFFPRLMTASVVVGCWEPSFHLTPRAVLILCAAKSS